MANYSVNYNDKRFTSVTNEKNKAINDATSQYDNMIADSDSFYNQQIQAVNDYTNQQKELQQANTDFAIEKINQQKEQAEKDYIREQKGAYVDWQQQSNQYGANAETMASQGLNGSGYSESSQVSMYNTYQNRLGSAREVYNQAKLNYDNGIKDAQLQNNVELAKIAYQGLQSSLALALEGFQYKNTLLETKMNTIRDIDNTYYSRWKDVLSQINTENALNEQARQYDQDMKYKQATLAEQKRQHNEEMKYKNATLAEQKRQHDEEMKYKQDTLNESKRQYNESKASSDGSANTGIKLNTKYYSGTMPALLVASINKYGTFEGAIDNNGTPYQPKGVMYNGKDYGTIHNSGLKYTKTAKNLQTGKDDKITQKVWETSDGKLWVWNGSKMAYEPY